MRSTQTLPEHYQKIGTLDISKNMRLMLLFNFVGIIGLVISGWLFLQILVWLRPGDVEQGFSVESSSITQIVLLLGALLVLVMFNTILHEAIHGFFFWLVTRSRPRFAFRWTYAYAAAPDWYIDRNPYLMIALAPVILISLIGILLFLFVPAGWLPSVWFVVVINAAGAVGDLAAAGWLLRQPANCLAQDSGSAIALYLPAAK